MRALNNYVFIKRDKAPEKIGSIVLPESAQDAPCLGEIVSLGPDVYTEIYNREADCNERVLAIGDRVLYKKYLGNEIIVEGQELVVVKDEDLLCVL